MKLSIITINRNNADGLRRTMNSVLQQESDSFEYIVVDGASTDGSVSIIKELEPAFCGRLKWVSEPDLGIYNAMNKGIAEAVGDYVQMLNSGDALNGPGVVGYMLDALLKAGNPPILYGNMVKCFPDGRRVCDKNFAGQPISMIGMYKGTLNHDSAYIKRELFDIYGGYDETLRICADWEWYLRSIVFGGEIPMYVDYDVTEFDMTGISEDVRNRGLIANERRSVLARALPEAILNDYDRYWADMASIRRIRRHKIPAVMLGLTDRVLFKMEKWAANRKNEKSWK